MGRGQRSAAASRHTAALAARGGARTVAVRRLHTLHAPTSRSRAICACLPTGRPCSHPAPSPAAPQPNLPPALPRTLSSGGYAGLSRKLCSRTSSLWLPTVLLVAYNTSRLKTCGTGRGGQNGKVRLPLPAGGGRSWGLQGAGWARRNGSCVASRPARAGDRPWRGRADDRQGAHAHVVAHAVERQARGEVPLEAAVEHGEPVAHAVAAEARQHHGAVQRQRRAKGVVRLAELPVQLPAAGCVWAGAWCGRLRGLAGSAGRELQLGGNTRQQLQQPPQQP